MRQRMTVVDSLRLVYREASRSPWICFSALRGTAEEDADDTSATPGPAMVDAGREHVLVVGGFLSHPYYYAPLGRILTRRGYVVHFDEAVNARPLRTHLECLRARVDAIVAATGRPVRMVGHSLGGIQAMALLLEHSSAVEQVIALGSPVIGGTPWRPLQRLVERVLDVEPHEAQHLAARLAPYVGRITTIAASNDRIAPPASCVLRGATNVVLQDLPHSDRALESHIGMVFMRTAFRAVLSALSRVPAGASQGTAEAPARELAV